MTFKKLCDIILKNKIPQDVKLLSDSGWECDATEMDGIYYNKEENVIVFTQNEDDHYYSNSEKWSILH